jgi:hypothetical protein
MGISWSLSKNVTSVLLDISEAGLLAFGLLLVVGLIGEYAESKRWKAKRKMFEMFVIVGVAMELMFDGGIFVFSKHLQTIADAELAGVIREAGNAKTSAEGAAKAALEAKESAKQANQDSKNAKLSAGQAVSLARSARQEADLARKAVGQASDQLARLRTDAQKVEAEANKTKSELMNLAVCMAPRIINTWFIGEHGTTLINVPPASTNVPIVESYVDPLKPMAGQVVFIEVVPDAEARRAALSIARTLMDAKWNVQIPMRMVDGLQDGVSVQPAEPPLPSVKGQVPDMSEYWHADDVANELVDFLHSYNWQARRGWWTDAQGKLVRDPKIAPAGAIRVQVGLYPPAVYVSPPGQKELNIRLEEMKRERENQEAEIKRKREAGWSTLAPAVRQRFEEAQKKWEAETKKYMSNQPCQVLNPPF